MVNANAFLKSMLSHGKSEDTGPVQKKVEGISSKMKRVEGKKIVVRSKR